MKQNVDAFAYMSLFEGEQSTRVFEGPCAFLGEL